MKNLLYKELKLALQAPAVLFLALSAMLLIPNYPYYVTFFYTALGIFFCCQLGRENHDIFFTLCLPVRKRDVVSARFLLAVLLEAAQMLLAVPFAVLRQSFDVLGGNAVGMDANLAFFALSLPMLGLFHLVFFPAYYKNPQKVGLPFVKGSIRFSCMCSWPRPASMRCPFSGISSTRCTARSCRKSCLCCCSALCCICF